MSDQLSPRVLAKDTQAILARHPDLALSFAQHRRTGKVHVLAPADPDVEPKYIRDKTDFTGWVSDPRPAVCGYLCRIYFGAAMDRGDRTISMFADHLLCGHCHKALGPHSGRAFDRPQPTSTCDE